MPQDIPDQETSLVLCLSGGGFRATFFHLGVLRLLRDIDLLARVHVICSVSGGSILAAHVCLNWDRYNVRKFDDGPFLAASAELAMFGMSDLRGRAVRRTIARAGVGGITPMLIAEYDKFYNGAQLASLSPSAPELHILSTSMTTGGFVDFGRGSVSVHSSRSGAELNSSTFPVSTIALAKAVAASSAFPPAFRPVRVTRRELHASESEFPQDEFLTDGGVFDNLGTHRMARLISEDSHPLTVLVSDASASFDWRVSQRRWGLIPRNVRASDILMGRVASLEAEATKSWSQPVRRLSIRDVVLERDIQLETEYKPQDIDIQRACRFLRTDLDSFSFQEISVLVRHGYESALSAIQDMVAVAPDPNLITDPCPSGWPNPHTLKLIPAVRSLGRVVDNLNKAQELSAQTRRAARQIFGTPMSDDDRRDEVERKTRLTKEAQQRRRDVKRIEKGARRRIFRL